MLTNRQKNTDNIIRYNVAINIILPLNYIFIYIKYCYKIEYYRNSKEFLS